jgi:hypothetical protein
MIFSWNLQAQVLTVQTLKDTTNAGMEFTFPKVQSTQRPEVARKINEYLQINELNLSKASLNFEYLKGQEDLIEYDFVVLANTANLFTVQFTGKRCPRLCFGFNRYYTFDARTGIRIGVKEIFADGGRGNLMKSIIPDYKSRLKAHLESSQSYTPEYKDCLQNAESLSEFPFQELYLLENSLVVTGGQCLDVTAGETMDDVYPLAFEKFWWSLSDYGLTFFVTRHVAGAYNNVILHGKIDGKYAFTFLLIPDKNNTTRLYGYEIYDKYRQNINVNGSVKGNQIQFHELDAKNLPQATFTGTWDGTRITGTFKNLKTNKEFPFTAGR